VSTLDDPTPPSQALPPRRAEFPPVLTTALAAELLQVHAESLRKMVRAGRIPCHRLPGGRGMRFLRDELLEWLGAQPAAPLVAPFGPGAVSPGADLAAPRAPNAAH
jgi:excisionase family DNA binding protein